MKKLLAVLFCFLFAVCSYADERTSTTLLSYPAGIFDNLTSGDTSIENAEIGARKYNHDMNGGDIYGYMQRQELDIHGNFEVNSATEIKNNFILSYIQGSTPPEFKFTNITIYPSKNSFNNQDYYRFMSAGNSTPTTINSLETGKVWAYNNFNGSSTDTTQINAVSSTIDIYNLSLKSDTRTLTMPLTRFNGGNAAFDGSAYTWKSPINAAATPSVYGAWEIANITDVDGCNNKDIEFMCTTGGGSTCNDMRKLEGINSYDMRGGFHMELVKGRKECRLSGEVCVMDTYFDFAINNNGNTYNDNTDAHIAQQPTPCPLEYGPSGSTESFANLLALNNIYIGSPDPNPGPVCNVLCQQWNEGAACRAGTKAATCVVSGSVYHLDSYWWNINDNAGSWNNSTVTSTSCVRTPWAVGTGLECPNVWEEETFLLISCGPNTGRFTGADTRYEMRQVTCNRSDSRVSPKYLVLH